MNEFRRFNEVVSLSILSEICATLLAFADVNKAPSIVYQWKGWSSPVESVLSRRLF